MQEVTLTLTQNEYDYLIDLADRRGISATQKATEIVTDSLGLDDHLDKVIARAIEEMEHNEPDFYSIFDRNSVADCEPCCCNVASPSENVERISSVSSHESESAPSQYEYSKARFFAKAANPTTPELASESLSDNLQDEHWLNALIEKEMNEPLEFDDITPGEWQKRQRKTKKRRRRSISEDTVVNAATSLPDNHRSIPPFPNTDYRWTPAKPLPPQEPGSLAPAALIGKDSKGLTRTVVSFFGRLKEKFASNFVL